MARIALLFVCFFSLVLAGSRHWQPPLGRDSESNRTSSRKISARSKQLGKRAYPMVPTSDSVAVWPNRQIRYCFENDAAKTALNTDLLDAWQIWLTAGLNSVFTILEVDSQTCADDRTNTLLIAYTGGAADDGYLQTSIGYIGPDNRVRSMGLTSATNARIGRPVMALSDRTDIGMLNTVYNYAHEWGHAWGLYHEHQNPNFWDGVNGALSGKVFGPSNMVTYNGANIENWQCANLKDYPSSIGLVVQSSSGNSGRWTACTSWALAVSKRFSAYDYLPFLDNRAKGSTGHKSGNVDWQSIMLYNSKAGGLGTATSTDDDNRLPILFQSDGSIIPFNIAPSIQDIDALETLYGLTQTKKSLLQKVGGSTTSKFKSLFNKSKGSSSSSSCL